MKKKTSHKIWRRQRNDLAGRKLPSYIPPPSLSCRFGISCDYHIFVCGSWCHKFDLVISFTAAARTTEREETTLRKEKLEVERKGDEPWTKIHHRTKYHDVCAGCCLQVPMYPHQVCIAVIKSPRINFAYAWIISPFFQMISFIHKNSIFSNYLFLIISIVMLSRFSSKFNLDQGLICK